MNQKTYPNLRNGQEDDRENYFFDKMRICGQCKCAVGNGISKKQPGHKPHHQVKRVATTT